MCFERAEIYFVPEEVECYQDHVSYLMLLAAEGGWLVGEYSYS